MTSVKVEKFIKAAPAEVYHYLTNSTALRDWMCDIATADAHLGGRLYMSWAQDYYTSGEFLRLEKDKAVSFIWFGRGEPHKTRVDISLKKQKGGTLLKLAHRNIGTGSKWAEIAKVYKMEWESGLENLASVLETGADLRITRRPMMGINISDFDAVIAARIGVPVDYGTRLDGVIDGMGAQKAGLQKDDVVIAIDGRELVPGTSLISVLGTKRAGDVVDVTFYRGAEKKTTKMTLSGRPMPPFPTTPLELSSQVAEIYHQFEKEVEDLFNSASEEECSHKPAPAEWSAKEVLAHLIQNEFAYQNYVSDIIGGNEPMYDDYSGNLQARIDATLAIFPTKTDMLRELKAHDAESIAFLAHLPGEVVTHKGRYWKIAFNASQNPYHLQAHLEQIKAALTAAK